MTLPVETMAQRVSIWFPMASTLPTLFTDQFVYDKEGLFKWDLHALWKVPLNVASNILSGALLPVACLADLVASAIFYAYGSHYSTQKDAKVSARFCAAMAAIDLLIAAICLARIFYPPVGSMDRIAQQFSFVDGEGRNIGLRLIP